jgi:integrase
LEPFTFHDLRHTHVAWLIDADWSEYRIVRRMGWKDSRMLYTTYGHLLDKHNREGMANLEERWIEPASSLDAQTLFAE